MSKLHDMKKTSGDTSYKERVASMVENKKARLARRHKLGSDDDSKQEGEGQELTENDS